MEADVSRRDIFYFDAVNEGSIRFLDKNYIETGVQNKLREGESGCSTVPNIDLKAG